MAKTSAILVRTSFVKIDEIVYKNIIDTLMQNGWNIDNENGFSFMTNGSYEFEYAKGKDFNVVVDLIRHSIVDGKECFIKLVGDGSTSIEVTYLNPNSIMFSITDDVVNLKSIDLIDFSYYLERLSSIFDVIDLFRIECIYD